MRPLSGSISSRNPLAGTPSGGPDAAWEPISAAVVRIASASAPSHLATRAYIGGSFPLDLPTLSDPEGQARIVMRATRSP